LKAALARALSAIFLPNGHLNPVFLATKAVWMSVKSEKPADFWWMAAAAQAPQP
jgi:hypothetical protein